MNVVTLSAVVFLSYFSYLPRTPIFITPTCQHPHFFYGFRNSQDVPFRCYNDRNLKFFAALFSPWPKCSNEGVSSMQVHYRNDGTGRDCYINNAMTVMSRSGKLSPSKDEEDTLKFWSSPGRGRLGGLKTGGSAESSPNRSFNGEGSLGRSSEGNSPSEAFDLTKILETRFPLSLRRVQSGSSVPGRVPTAPERFYESTAGRQFRTGRFSTPFDSPPVQLRLPKITSAVFE